MTAPDLTRSILVVEDDPLLRKLIQATLETSGHSYHIEFGKDEEGGPSCTHPERFSLFMIGADRGERRSSSLLSGLRKQGNRSPVIRMSSGSPSGSSLAPLGPIRNLPKPFSLEELRAALDWALPGIVEPSRSLVGSFSDPGKVTEAAHGDILCVPHLEMPGGRRTLVAKSQIMKDVLRLIRAAALSNATVLLLGESGTGKTLLARLIHELSSLRFGAFVVFQPSNVPEGLVQSELFGHQKGAFTGATEDRMGKCEQASGGTFFLDEVGDLPGPAQTALLRFLQERTFEPLGSSEKRRSDARVIAATHQDLPKRVAEGLFREDLYYRLNVLAIRVPPLREHLEDVPLLIESALRELAARYEKPVPVIEEPALNFLAHYAWPGNIRQLEHTVERMVLLSSKDPIREADLETYLVQPLGQEKKVPIKAPPREKVPKEMIDDALVQSNGNNAKAARNLGISRTWFYKLKGEYGA